MVEAVMRPRRRGAGGRQLLAAHRYAAMGWPVCAGAHPVGRRPGGAATGRACSCDRVGCPAPGAHPLSPAWKLQATVDHDLIRRWWTASPAAGILLVTGRVFDVLDVPAAAGQAALARLERDGMPPGPVALGAGRRALFFVASRAALADDAEWWPCHLDCVPETVPEIGGLRWHCTDSYVLAPPSRLAGGLAARWLRPPGRAPLPDALRLLGHLADACEEVMR